MKKLSDDTRDLISFAVKYCNLLKIDSLLIDKSGIRAKQDEFAVYLIEPADLDYLEFDTLFIDRISSLAPRIKMFDTSKIDYSIGVVNKELDSGETLVNQLVIKGGNTKINFNCANPARLNANSLPKKVADKMTYSFQMDKACLDVLSRGVSAMGAAEVKLYSKDGTVYAQVKDIEGDTLEHKVNDSYEVLISDGEPEFSFRYIFKMIVPLLREACKEDDFSIVISRRGIMKLNINDLSMYIFPEQ